MYVRAANTTPVQDCFSPSTKDGRMFGRVTTTCFTAMAALTLASAPARATLAQPAPVVSLSAMLPATAAAPVARVTEAARLGAAEMARVQGDGWLSKFWKRYKSVIIKIIQVIIDYLKTPTTTTSSTTWVASLAQDQTETYEAEDVDQTTYASQTDYNVGNVQSQSSYDTGYALTDISYGGGGRDVEYMQAY
jgi:hypothetical protein